ncbi:hypothetical protein RHGRI_011663 [Rhododendron griersonianum]|uniref:Secreted protein n=1 Tax=Rhododendron griersonianum TaxID=479676 RepID=A0AAV6KMT5_9ERIC|nr:hypothetical protein RHGRI_011663 [Rhododendron griersonianum]
MGLPIGSGFLISLLRLTPSLCIMPYVGSRSERVGLEKCSRTFRFCFLISLVQVAFCYREANGVADLLAKHAAVC